MDVVTVLNILEDKHPDGNFSVFFLKGSDTVQDALRKLAGYRVIAAPVQSERDSSKHYILDIADITAAIVTRNYDLSFMKDSLDNFSATVRLQSYVTIDIESNALEAILVMAESGLHRLVVTKDGRPVGVISQMDLVRIVTKFPVLIPKTLIHHPLHQIMVRNPLCVVPSELALTAFAKCVAHHYSGVAVVDEINGNLLANLSVSDLKGKGAHDLEKMVHSSVQHFLKDTHQMLQKSPMLCHPDDEFQKVVNLMRQNHVHRVYVVDAHQKPVGVFSATDVVYQLAKHAAQTK